METEPVGAATAGEDRGVKAARKAARRAEQRAALADQVARGKAALAAQRAERLEGREAVMVREAAALLGCGPDAVRRFVRSRQLRVVSGSRPLLLARADVERLAAERAGEPAEAAPPRPSPHAPAPQPEPPGPAEPPRPTEG